MKKAFLIAAIAIFPNAAIAQTPKPCLTRAEADGLMTFALPSAMRALTKHCTPSLPATSALVQSGALIAARYQSDADKAWPVARIGFDKMSGMKISEQLGEEAARGLIEAGLGAGLVEQIKPQDCPKIDRFIDILQPLPAKNMAMLMTAFLELGSETKGSKSPFNICPAEKTGN